MNFTKTLSLFVCVVCICIPAQAQTIPSDSVRHTLTAQEKAEIASRIALKQLIFQSIDAVVAKTHDDQANEIDQAFHHDGILAVPSPVGFMIAESPKNSTNNFLLVIVLKSDAKISQQWDDFVDNTNAASEYMPGPDAILLGDPNDFTPTWYAISALQQGNHEVIMSTHPYDWHNVQLFCEDDCVTAEFQNRLMAELGGKAYAQALAREVTRLRKSSNHKTQFIAGRTTYDAALDSLGGKPRSQMERDFRETSLWINAVFNLIDQDYKGDKEDVKSQFLYALDNPDHLVTTSTS